MDHAASLCWILASPLIAFLLLIFFGRRLGRVSPWVTVVALAISCSLTLNLYPAVHHGHRLAVRWAWLSLQDPRWSIGLAVDGLTWIMLFVVTSIGTMIAVYSIGYMRGDPRCSRFFAYLALFCTSMLLLVMADHFVPLYAGWELVGLCSYLLIGFWFEKPAAAAAARKAFITTRIGDTFLLVGILTLAFQGVSLQFSQLNAVRAALPTELLTLISACVFFGAVGKSAQFPLHVWLPDAMEGPTPVSALIHAATMVAAGVYLVARTFPLFTPDSLRVVLTLGLITHLFAGTVALTQTDIKRVLAYSTLSQLGLMMTALGIGARSAAMFHLFTHAFFKALLFLAAGSVIHATHEQELSKIGGLWKRAPITAAVFLIASLSMGGTFLLSGFWSKDAILLAASASRPWLLWTLLGGAAMTASYIFRLYLRCFHGAEPHGPGTSHAHESPFIMTLPMVVLAVGAAFIGLVESPWFGHPFLHLLGDHHVHDRIDPLVVVCSTCALAMGIWLAWMVGFKRRNLLPAGLRPLGHRLYRWAANKYYVDEAYERWIIAPVLDLTARLAQFDQRVIDGAVNGAGRLGAWISGCKERFDRLVVDRIVNGIGSTVRGFGATLRIVQTGVIHQYLFVVVTAVIVLAVILRR